jgi:hypothetical protein
VTRAPRPSASRLAAVGAALSLVASSASVGLAADPAVAPVGTGAASAKAASPKAAPTRPPASPPAAAPRTPPPATADEAAVDDELIEFLGSIDDTTEEGDWLDFLSNTDIDKVAQRGSKTPPRSR